MLTYLRMYDQSVKFSTLDQNTADEKQRIKNTTRVCSSNQSNIAWYSHLIKADHLRSKLHYTQCKQRLYKPIITPFIHIYTHTKL